MVLFCKSAEYEDRLNIVFNSFDLDGGGVMDRRELSDFIRCCINGLCKAIGIKLPNKHQIAEFT